MEIERYELYRMINTNEKLPENLIVNGYCDLTWCHDIELPNNMTLNHSISMRHSKIKRLPNNFIVHGYIDLTDSDVLYVPEETILDNGIFYGKMNCSVADYNKMRKDKTLKKIFFSRKNKNIIKKLLYIPELFQNVFTAIRGILSH